MDFSLLLDILLLPKGFYKKLTDKKPALYAGIIAVGIMDIFFFLVEHKKLFVAKPGPNLYFNATLTLVLILLIGFIDVLFFSLPLFDLFKRFKKEKDSPGRGDELPKLMKIYILASLFFFPVNIMFYIFGNPQDTAALSGNTTIYVLGIIMQFWITGLVSRGINVIYNFEPAFKRLVFLAVYIWSMMIGLAIGYITDNWLLRLFI